jgi:hypothetical protein
MADPDSARETDVEGVNEILDEGLRSCRHLMSEYRHLLGSPLAASSLGRQEAANDGWSNRSAAD